MNRNARPNRLALLALVGAGAAGLIAQEADDAPLAESKKALKQLRSDQASKNADEVGSKLRGAIPSIDIPSPGGLELPAPPRPMNDEQLKKQEADRKNWLLNGVRSLEKRRENEDPYARESDEHPDPADPDFLLKVFARQKTEEAKDSSSSKLSPTIPNDPFAPFLQNWLSDSSRSPAALPGSLGEKHALSASDRAGLAGRGTATTGADTRPRLGAIETTTNTALLGGGEEHEGNPFLKALELSPASSQTAGLSAQALVTPAAPPAAEIGAPKPPIQPIDPPRREAEDSRPKPPPSQLENDKKYFPQLKRF